MYAQGPATSWAELAARLDERERRVHELEAENLELRRQLDNLRRGLGVTLLIDGRAVPMMVADPAAPVAASYPAQVPAPAPYVASYPAQAPTPAPYAASYPAQPVAAAGPYAAAYPARPVAPAALSARHAASSPRLAAAAYPAPRPEPVPHAWPAPMGSALYAASQPGQPPHARYATAQHAPSWPASAHAEDLPTVAQPAPTPHAAPAAADWPASAYARTRSTSAARPLRSPAEPPIEPRPRQRRPLHDQPARPAADHPFTDDSFLL